MWIRILVVVIVQYTMLTGKPPFHTSGITHAENAMIDMMRLIKAGNFKTDTPEWQYVSDEAKSLIKGNKYEAVLFKSY